MGVYPSGVKYKRLELNSIVGVIVGPKQCSEEVLGIVEFRTKDDMIVLMCSSISFQRDALRV